MCAKSGLLLSPSTRLKHITSSHHFIDLIQPSRGAFPLSDVKEKKHEKFSLPFLCSLHVALSLRLQSALESTKNRFQHITNVIAHHHHLTAVNNFVTCCYTFQLFVSLNSLILQSNNAFSVDADVVHFFLQQFSSQFNRKHAFPFFDLFRAIQAVQFVCLELRETGNGNNFNFSTLLPRFSQGRVDCRQRRDVGVNLLRSFGELSGVHSE